jgi:opacity protein-like surface antigen
MLNKFLKVAALSAVLFSASARAEEKLAGFNITVGGDKVFAVRKNDDLFTANNTKLDNGYGFQASVNNMMDNNFELGVEAGYRIDKQKHKNNNGSSLLGANGAFENKMFTLLAKGTYYVDLGTNIMPYVGVGAGIARPDVKIENSTLLNSLNGESVIKKVKFAYSGEAGVAAVVSTSAMVGAGVQYFGLADLKGDDFEDSKKGEAFGDKKIKTGEWSVKGFLKLFI